MNVPVDSILITLVLTNLLLLGSSQLNGCIRVGAFQGFVLGLLPLAVHGDEFTARLLLLIVGSMSLKGVVFPRLLTRSIRERRPPHRITHLFVDDPRAVSTTIERLHDFARARPDVRLVPSHCPEAFARHVEGTGLQP